MKTIKRYPLIVLMLAVILPAYAQQKGFTITGKVTGYKDGTKIMLQSYDENKIVAEGKISNNIFKLKGTISEAPESTILIIPQGEGMDYCMLYIGNETIEISADKKDFPSDVKIKGSVYQDEQSKLDTALRPIIKDRDKVSEEYFAIEEQTRNTDSIKLQYWGPNGKFTVIDNKYDAVTNDFIRKNINTNAGLYNLITRRSSFTRDELNVLYSQLKHELKNNKYGKALASYLKNPTLNKGDKIYDFEAVDMEGKTHKLSQYLNKDKYVLLEFSTSHCSWCKKALPVMTEIYNEKKQDMEIVSLYVDKTPKDWIEETNKEKLPYIRLYNEAARLSDPYMQYDIHATPTFILISPDGKILKKIGGFSYTLKEDIYTLMK